MLDLILEKVLLRLKLELVQVLMLKMNLVLEKVLVLENGTGADTSADAAGASIERRKSEEK